MSTRRSFRRPGRLGGLALLSACWSLSPWAYSSARPSRRPTGRAGPWRRGLERPLPRCQPVGRSDQEGGRHRNVRRPLRRRRGLPRGLRRKLGRRKDLRPSADLGRPLREAGEGIQGLRPHLDRAHDPRRGRAERDPRRRFPRAGPGRLGPGLERLHAPGADYGLFGELQKNSTAPPAGRRPRPRIRTSSASAGSNGDSGLIARSTR